MNQKQRETDRKNLEAVRQQFETWRGQRIRGSRIPQSLWQAAVGLSDRHSAGEIARVLGLHYGRLKQRIGALDANSQRPVAGGRGVCIGWCIANGHANVVEPVDFRKGIDGLAGVYRNVICKDPFSGYLFVFRNGRGTAIKILAYDKC